MRIINYHSLFQNACVYLFQCAAVRACENIRRFVAKVSSLSNFDRTGINCSEPVYFSVHANVKEKKKVIYPHGLPERQMSACPSERLWQPRTRVTGGLMTAFLRSRINIGVNC